MTRCTVTASLGSLGSLTRSADCPCGPAGARILTRLPRHRPQAGSSGGGRAVNSGRHCIAATLRRHCGDIRRWRHDRLPQHQRRYSYLPFRTQALTYLAEPITISATPFCGGDAWPQGTRTPFPVAIAGNAKLPQHRTPSWISPAQTGTSPAPAHRAATPSPRISPHLHDHEDFCG